MVGIGAMVGWTYWVVSDGVVSDGVVSDGVVSDGVVSDGAVSDGAVSDGVVSDGVVVWRWFFNRDSQTQTHHRPHFESFLSAFRVFESF